MRSSSELTERAGTSRATCTVLGVEYFVGDLGSAADLVLDRVRSGQGGYSCLCGVHGIVTAQHSETMMGVAARRLDELPRRRPGRVADAPLRRGGRPPDRRARPDAARDRRRTGRRHAPLPVRVDPGRARAARADAARALSAGDRRRQDRPAVPAALRRGEHGHRQRDRRRAGRRRLGRPRAAQAGRVAAPQRRAVRTRGGAGRGGGVRLPRGDEAARPGVDAGRRPRVAAPALAGAAPARGPVRDHEHRVRGPGHDRDQRRVRARRAQARRPGPGPTASADDRRHPQAASWGRRGSASPP